MSALGAGLSQKNILVAPTWYQVVPTPWEKSASSQKAATIGKTSWPLKP